MFHFLEIGLHGFSMHRTFNLMFWVAGLKTNNGWHPFYDLFSFLILSFDIVFYFYIKNWLWFSLIYFLLGYPLFVT
jgi:hypothetical protein